MSKACPSCNICQSQYNKSRVVTQPQYELFVRVKDHTFLRKDRTGADVMFRTFPSLMESQLQPSVLLCTVSIKDGFREAPWLTPTQRKRLCQRRPQEDKGNRTDIFGPTNHAHKRSSILTRWFNNPFYSCVVSSRLGLSTVGKRGLSSHSVSDMVKKKI